MNNDELSKKVEKITKEFKNLGSEIAELSALSTDRLEKYKKEAMNDVHEVISNTSEEAKKHMDVADEYVHKNPWTVVAGASLVGLVAGVVISLVSKKK